LDHHGFEDIFRLAAVVGVGFGDRHAQRHGPSVAC
jgi:hypothetical protein